VKEDKKKPYPPRVSNGERQAWDRLFRDYIKALEEKKPVIVTGDFNVAHEPIGTGLLELLIFSPPFCI